jgi:hypothetical protein
MPGNTYFIPAKDAGFDGFFNKFCREAARNTAGQSPVRPQAGCAPIRRQDTRGGTAYLANRTPPGGKHLSDSDLSGIV